jgi:Flp pilus assembly pilin Flp
MLKLLARSWASDTSGAAALEYGLLIGAVVLGLVLWSGMLTDGLAGFFASVIKAIGHV